MSLIEIFACVCVKIKFGLLLAIVTRFTAKTMLLRIGSTHFCTPTLVQIVVVWWKVSPVIEIKGTLVLPA